MRSITFFMLLFASLMSFGSYAQDDREDVVYLKNGTIYRGTLIEQVPNVSYKIEIAGGSVINITAAEVEKITKEKKVGTNESNYADDRRSQSSYGRSRGEFKYRDKGYFFQGEIMAGFFEGGTWIVNGYKFNHYAALGFGFGIEGVGSDVHMNNDQNYAGMYIPLFAYLSGDILRKKITPFYQVQAGYTFWPAVNDPLGILGGNAGSTTTSQKGGFMGGAGFGCRFYKNSGFNVSFSANVNIKNPTLSNTNTYYDYYGNPYNVTTHTSPWLVLPVFMFGLGF